MNSEDFIQIWMISWILKFLYSKKLSFTCYSNRKFNGTCIQYLSVFTAVILLWQGRTWLSNYLFTSSFCRNESGHTYGDKDCCCRGKRGEDPHNCWGVQELFQREVNVGDKKGEEKTCSECAGFTESFEVWTKKFTDYFLLVVSKTWNNIKISNNYFCTNVMLGVFKNP